MTRDYVSALNESAVRRIEGAVNTVDFTRGKSHERFVKGVRRTETRFPVYCVCGNVRWLKKADALKAVSDDAGPCYHCAQSAKGTKGYAAAVAKHGERWVVPHVQAYRLAHPSSLESAVTLLLDEMGATYRREVMLCTKSSGKKRRCHLLDFVVTLDGLGLDVVIDVRGAYVHAKPDMVRRDTLKMRLLKRRHIPVKVIEEADIRAGRAETLIADFLHQFASEEGTR